METSENLGGNVKGTTQAQLHKAPHFFYKIIFLDTLEVGPTLEQIRIANGEK